MLLTAKSISDLEISFMQDLFLFWILQTKKIMEIVEKVFEVFGKIYEVVEKAKANTSNCGKAATRCKGLSSIIHNCLEQYKRYNGINKTQRGMYQKKISISTLITCQMTHNLYLKGQLEYQKIQIHLEILSGLFFMHPLLLQ